MLASTSALNLNMTRARRCGLVAAQPGWRGIGGVDRLLEVGGGAEADLGLDLALVGVEHVALALARSEAGTADEMVDARNMETRPRIKLGGRGSLDPPPGKCQLRGVQGSSSMRA